MTLGAAGGGGTASGRYVPPARGATVTGGPVPGPPAPADPVPGGPPAGLTPGGRRADAARHGWL
ncbi:hypothetical protein [Micromonospora sp. NBRC 101691]|uniref:hypothetical protein n=1 Tax=Micromonospora sp. NBRC 101691 TaxID=3032198 RepID=UPI0024A261EE|nr:hypothetical protein [Micromonospora sp. NBRC 101691]GLY23916.1 hypothetical protein Misp04_36480 [Micromonospora sp. NBRC 101691]